jgi:hypothetical protein
METVDSRVEEPDERAMEEWRQLETIIGRYEGQEFQVWGWLFVLLGVFGTALYAEKPKLSGPVFAAVGGSLVLVYCSIELVIRIPKLTSVSRKSRRLYVEKLPTTARGSALPWAQAGRSGK